MAAPLSQVRGRFFLREVQLNLNDDYLPLLSALTTEGCGLTQNQSWWCSLELWDNGWECDDRYNHV
jgi:hypothetical protein